MVNKKVAGTIILTNADGEKQFLMDVHDQDYSFITTSIADDMTGLASILEYFKKILRVDTSSLRLFDLANAKFAEGTVPLFVFEADKVSKEENILPAGFQWTRSPTMRNLLEQINFEGVPFF